MNKWQSSIWSQCEYRIFSVSHVNEKGSSYTQGKPSSKQEKTKPHTLEYFPAITVSPSSSSTCPQTTAGLHDPEELFQPK